MSDTLKPKKMVTKGLLLKTPDNRCFFTQEKYYPLLIEFGRSFDAEISVVKFKDQNEVLELEDLAKSICSKALDKYPDYEVLEIKLSASRKSIEKRQIKLKRSKDVSEYIHEKILNGDSISISDLESKFMFHTKQSLSNYLTRAKRDLRAKGYHVIKERPGQYRLEPKSD